VEQYDKIKYFSFLYRQLSRKLKNFSSLSSRTFQGSRHHSFAMNADQAPMDADHQREDSLEQRLAAIQEDLDKRATKPTIELSPKENQAFRDLFKLFSVPNINVQNQNQNKERVVPIRDVRLIWALLKIPLSEEDLQGLPDKFTAKDMLELRSRQIKTRTKRDELRQHFVTLSLNGKRISPKILVDQLTLGGQRSYEDAMKIVLFAAFPDADPPIETPPEGEFWVDVDTCVELCFKVHSLPRK
jgi:hypothetical protein